DEAEFEEVVYADDDLDQPRTFARDAADLVLDETDPDAEPGSRQEAETAPMEADSLADEEAEALDAARGDDGPDADEDSRLDEALEETFPASDPVSINPRSG